MDDENKKEEDSFLVLPVCRSCIQKKIAVGRKIDLDQYMEHEYVFVDWNMYNFVITKIQTNTQGVIMAVLIATLRGSEDEIVGKVPEKRLNWNFQKYR